MLLGVHGPRGWSPSSKDQLFHNPFCREMYALLSIPKVPNASRQRSRADYKDQGHTNCVGRQIFFQRGMVYCVVLLKGTLICLFVSKGLLGLLSNSSVLGVPT